MHRCYVTSLTGLTIPRMFPFFFFFYCAPTNTEEAANDSLRGLYGLFETGPGAILLIQFIITSFPERARDADGSLVLASGRMPLT